jgi:hypothetical protein
MKCLLHLLQKLNAYCLLPSGFFTERTMRLSRRYLPTAHMSMRVSVISRAGVLPRMSRRGVCQWGAVLACLMHLRQCLYRPIISKTLMPTAHTSMRASANRQHGWMVHKHTSRRATANRCGAGIPYALMSMYVSANNKQNPNACCTYINAGIC